MNSEDAEVRVREIMEDVRQVEKSKKSLGRGWWGCKERHRLARILSCIRKKGKDEKRL